jgi:hypothetical protein
MEKVIYILWRDPKVDQESFAAALRTEVADELLSEGVHGLQINVVDAAVAGGSHIHYGKTKPQMEAVLHVWVDSALPRFRQPIDDIVAKACGRFAAYLVTEGQILRNTKHAPEPGSRTFGWAQIGMSARLPDMTRDVWLDLWRQHTEVALSTQPIFAYQQNAFSRPLTPDAPHLHALVEECFPMEAMSDPHVFFDAAGDEEKYQRNFKKMMDSVTRFADLDSSDVFPTSQYIIKSIV